MGEAAIIAKPISGFFANLFNLRWTLNREGYDPCDEWDANAILGLPDGLWYQDGEIKYECENCGQATQLPVDVSEFEYGNPHNVCGRSPRCCP